MINYTKLIYQLKRKIANFSSKITKDLSKPKSKFVLEMLYGMIAKQSVLLSEIARSLKENTTLKKIIERLSRNLQDFKNKDILIENYIANISSLIDNDTIFCTDGSDLAKPNSKKLEALGKVRDGNTGKIVDGYHTFDIAALTSKHEMPVSVYTHVFSSVEEGFKSENLEAFAGLKFVKKSFGNIGTYALDRGYDNNKFYKYFADNKLNFVIRSKKNRNVLYKNKSINILKLANKYKGKYVHYYKDKNGKKHKLKFSYIPIKLPALADKKLTLVVIRGYGKIPMMLISSLQPESKALSKAILEIYIKRWKIEEYFRLKKDKFDFENIRVQSLKRIRMLNWLLTILIGFIAILSEKRNTTQLGLLIYKLSERIYDIPMFDYYAIADGFKAILEKARTGVKSFIHGKLKNRRSQQLKLPGLL